MTEPIRPTILCVDDDPQLLSGLQLSLRRQYEVLTATSGIEGLSKLRSRRDVIAILSDMRMPIMDGAEFLREARAIQPDAPRILLTGNADIESAISAVNNGQIFRFLVKPCPPDVLLGAFEAAREQYRLITAERILLGNTLNGTIKALTDVLSMSSPLAFGHASSIKKLAGELAQRMLPAHRWAVEMTAMLAPLGAVSLPDNVAEKLYSQKPLSDDERRMVSRLPALTDSLLNNIPRLELVRAMIAILNNSTPSPELRLTKQEYIAAQRGCDVLRVALDYVALDAEAHPTDVVIGTLKARTGRYDPTILAALDEIYGKGGVVREIREIPTSSLREGMVLAADMRLVTGAMLVPRGLEVTQSLVERIRNLRLGSVVSPVKVYMHR